MSNQAAPRRRSGCSGILALLAIFVAGYIVGAAQTRWSIAFDLVTPTATFIPSATLTPSNTFTPSVTFTPSLTPTASTTLTSSATFTATLTPTVTQTPTPSDTPTSTLTLTATLTPTITRTPTGSDTSTSTLTRTLTRTLTATNTPSSTPSATDTLLPTSTATITPTLNKTDLAATHLFNASATAEQHHQNLTATADINDRATGDAQVNASSTADQQHSDASSTAVIRQAAATQTADARTQVAANHQSTLDFVASFSPISPAELSTYPDKHLGDDVVVHGTVLTVDESGALQVTLSGGYVIVVLLAPGTSLSNIYKGDSVTVYGTIDGTFTGQNGFGASITQTQLNLAIVTKP